MCETVFKKGDLARLQDTDQIVTIAQGQLPKSKTVVISYPSPFADGYYKQLTCHVGLLELVKEFNPDAIPNE